MHNVYFLFFNENGVRRSELLTYLESNESILDYHTSDPTNLFIVVSDLTATELMERMKGVANLAIFVFVRVLDSDIGSTVNGWLPEAAWQFVYKHVRQPIVTAVASVTPQPLPEKAPA